MDEEDSPGKKKKVGNYMLGRKIGEGRFTTVRVATHNIAHQQVAVKVIPKKVLAQKEVARRHFRRQTLLSQYVQHPNIVRLYEAMETSNSYYLVLEFADRGQFCHYLAKKRFLSEEETRRFAVQLVSAVDHMHVSGVVHRDLRLDNFLLDKENNLKISGFGHGSNPSPSAASTVPIGLSPAYAAPEMFTGKLGGPAVDIWSIGVCLYTMLVGKLPFLSESPVSTQQVLASIIQGCVPPPSLSPPCKNLLSRLLEPSEGKRITMTDLLKHPWLTKEGETFVERYRSVMKGNSEAVDLSVVRYLCQHFDYNESDLMYSLRERKVDCGCAAYHLMVKSLEDGFVPPGLSPRTATPPSAISSLTSSDSTSQGQGHDPDRIFPEVKTAPSSDSLRWPVSMRPVSYKTSVTCLRETRLRNNRPFRPKTFDPQMMPNVKHKKPLFTQNSKERLPEIKSKHTSERPDAKYGTFGRHRDAWENPEDCILNVRGKSPTRNGGFYVSYNSLTPQIMTFDPPAPPNTASGARLRSREKSNNVGVGGKMNRERSVMFGQLEEVVFEDGVETLQRQRSKFMCTMDLTTPKRTLSYGQPFSSPKKLSNREQRNAAIAVFKKITEQSILTSLLMLDHNRNYTSEPEEDDISEEHAVRRALRWNPEVTCHSPTSSTSESVERDDFLRPIIKVTISTCKS